MGDNRKSNVTKHLFVRLERAGGVRGTPMVNDTSSISGHFETDKAPTSPGHLISPALLESTGRGLGKWGRVKFGFCFCHGKRAVIFFPSL